MNREGHDDGGHGSSWLSRPPPPVPGLLRLKNSSHLWRDWWTEMGTMMVDMVAPDQVVLLRQSQALLRLKNSSHSLHLYKSNERSYWLPPSCIILFFKKKKNPFVMYLKWKLSLYILSYGSLTLRSGFGLSNL